MAADAFVRVADTVYDRATRALVAVHTRGTWYEPDNHKGITEWSVATPSKCTVYDGLIPIKPVHPMEAALAATRRNA
jgi:hypothetical protein